MWVGRIGTAVTVTQQEGKERSARLFLDANPECYQLQEYNSQSECYGASTMEHAHLWAKWPKTGAEAGYHPVACHLIDVAACFSGIWPALGPLYRKWICDRLQLCEDSAQKTLCYWIGLHDIGKISPAFQMLVPAAAAQVKGAGFTYPRRKLLAGTRIPHSGMCQ